MGGALNDIHKVHPLYSFSDIMGLLIIETLVEVSFVYGPGLEKVNKSERLPLIYSAPTMSGLAPT